MFSPNVTVKKDKKKKKKLAAFPPLELNESYEDAHEGKKKKKKIKSNTEGKSLMSDDFQKDITSVEGKKKKAKQNKEDSSLNVNGTSDMEEFQKKKKKGKEGKKRKSSISSLLEESLDHSFEGSPKKKKKKSKKEGEPQDVKEAEGQERSSHKSPKISNIDVRETFSTPKSAKKRRDQWGAEEMSSAKSPRKMSIDDSEKEELLKTPTKKETNVTTTLNSSKKSHKKIKEDIPSSTKDDDDVKNLDSVWSLEEELSLIDGMISKLGDNSKEPYRSSLRKVNWGEVAIPSRSAKECSEMVETLINKLTKYKSLSTLLQEARGVVCDSSSRLKRVLSPKLRFIMEYTKRHKSESSPNEIRAEAAAAWVDLPRKEKKRYEMEYQQEIQKLRGMMDLPPENPRTPFLIFYEAQVDKGGSKGMELKTKCLKTFNGMNMKEKSKYIFESCKEFARYVREYRDYKGSHPDWDVPMAKLSPRPVFDQYLEYLGMPKCPANVMGLFSAEMKDKGKLVDVDNNKRLFTLSAMFKELSEREKLRYKEKLVRLTESYASEYKSWKENADKDVIMVVETYIEKDGAKRFLFKNIVSVSMAKPKFSDEPEKPMNAFKMFSVKFQKHRRQKYKSVKEMKEACEVAWRSLPEESKSKYEERYREHMAAYKENLIEFVGTLGDVGKVYLGFKRLEFYNYFKEDIFENDFPNASYPVYDMLKKEVGTLAGVLKLPDEEDVKSSLKLSPCKGNDEGETDSDEESAGGDDSRSDEEESEQQQQSPIKEENSDDEDDDDDDDDGDVLPSWQTPKRPTHNDDQEVDSDDEDESDDDDDD